MIRMLEVDKRGEAVGRGMLTNRCLCIFFVLCAVLWTETLQSSVILVRDDNCGRKF